MLREHVDLQTYNTLNVHARARYFCELNNHDELQAAVALAKREQLPLLVLGEGSNVVLRTELLQRVVVRMRYQSVRVLAEDESRVQVRVGAGMRWQQWVEHCLAQGWYGLENLSLIPGTVGAAPVQNIGAYGVEVADCIDSVEYYDLATETLQTLDRAQCQFAYRDSVFKAQLAAKVIITHVVFSLRKQFEPQLSYRALADYLAMHSPSQPLTAALLSQAVCEIRRSKLPDLKVLPNAGSFFKNPVVSRKKLQQLQQSYPDIAFFPLDEQQVKLAAGWLIEQRGWKGRGDNGVQVHQQQALVLVNKQAASGEQVLALAAAIQQDIRQSYGVALEIEPVIID